jgi:hypothetical protein
VRAPHDQGLVFEISESYAGTTAQTVARRHGYGRRILVEHRADLAGTSHGDGGDARVDAAGPEGLAK